MSLDCIYEKCCQPRGSLENVMVYSTGEDKASTALAQILRL